MSRSFPATPAILLTIVLLLLPVPLHAADTYIITASAGPGGKISPSGDVTVAKGSDQLFVIEAFQGYRIENVMVDQRSLGAIPLFTFNKVNTNHVISATFSPVFGSLQVHSRPGGAEVLIDNTFYGTTDPGGPVTFTRIAPGIHSIRMLLAGYQEYKTEAQVNEGQTTIVPTAILVPVPTTVPTTTIPTTTPTTTATTTIPTTTPTTTATTTIPTTTPTTTATTTIPTTTPTTTATTTIPTTTPTTTIPTTEQTAVPNLTMPTIPENGAMHPATPGNLGVIIILAAGALAALVLSRDLLRSGRAHGVPLKRRLAAFALFAIPSIAMGVVLHWYLQYPGESGGGLNPELVVAAIPLLLYLVLSSIALMAGALISWPFRGTLKVHVVAGALATVIAFMGLIAGDPSRRFVTALMLLSAVLSTLVARWQEGTSWGGLAGSGDRDDRSGPADVPVEPGTPSLNNKGMFPPELTEKYEVTEFVGSGGLARVYRAQNLQTGEEVALKIPLQSDEKTGKSFLKEIVGWEGLNHENIVRVSGMNILPIPYVEMEYIPKTLSDLPKPLPPRSAARICRDVARGLLFAHERGIIHRDIKPQNILITYEGVPKITDWGMSKVMGVTGMPTITGFSLAYAAPEQLAPQTYGETDQRTDIYQLGCVLYELITGTVPFPGNDMVQVSAHILSETPRLPSTMNPDALPLDSIIMRCLEKSPENRYQDVRDLIRDLDAYLLSAETSDRYNIFED